MANTRIVRQNHLKDAIEKKLFDLFCSCSICFFWAGEGRTDKSIHNFGSHKAGAGNKLYFTEEISGTTHRYLTITNHLGIEKGVAKALKGVLLRDVISRIDFNVENQKQLSEIFFTCIASDGYKVVYSWNEIFNTSTGDHTFFITGKNGKAMMEQPDRMLMATTSDYKTGRRYIKGLSKIVVGRAQ